MAPNWSERVPVDQNPKINFSEGVVLRVRLAKRKYTYLAAILPFLGFEKTPQVALLHVSKREGAGFKVLPSLEGRQFCLCLAVLQA